MPCHGCGQRSLIRDDVTGNLLCESCGTIQEFDNYDTRVFGLNGAEGVFVRVGTSGTGSVLNYKEKKIYEANKLIDELAFKLDLIGQKVSEIKAMISRITDGEFGRGNWFPILIGACAYIVMRTDNKSLSVEEVSNVIGCEIHELGRMISRVVDHLNIKLPEFDIVNSFEKVLRKLLGSGRIESEKMEVMRKQGVFLLQCAVKWFLSTGRRPLPVVVAVLVLVMELNGVEGVKIEEMAREVHATVSACRLRYKELLEALVKVAQALPWGKDVTVKNVVKNAPFVIRYMEMKSMAKSNKEGEGLDVIRFDLGEMMDECLRKEVAYGFEEDIVRNDDSQYFEVGRRNMFDNSGDATVDKLQLSHECLSVIYDKFLNEDSCDLRMVENGKIHGRKRKRDFELHMTEWWNGKSEMSKKLLLKQILEKDVGLNALPASFVNGLKANKRRKAKINAAKLRIAQVMHPWDSDLGNGDDVYKLKGQQTQKRKTERHVQNIDWEDFVIETLLLHEVKEEEIETGHYNRLLDLHVFNSGVA